MTDKIKFTPYQEGDFKDEKFFGPEYHITYPAECDPSEKMIAWANSGYHFGPIINNDFSKPFTIPIKGDIPQETINSLEESGVKVELFKKRGLESITFNKKNHPII